MQAPSYSRDLTNIPESIFSGLPEIPMSRQDRDLRSHLKPTRRVCGVTRVQVKWEGVPIAGLVIHTLGFSPAFEKCPLLLLAQ